MMPGAKADATERSMNGLSFEEPEDSKPKLVGWLPKRNEVRLKPE
jgi:hypothetical protein